MNSQVKGNGKKVAHHVTLREGMVVYCLWRNLLKSAILKKQVNVAALRAAQFQNQLISIKTKKNETKAMQRPCCVNMYYVQFRTQSCKGFLGNINIALLGSKPRSIP